MNNIATQNDFPSACHMRQVSYINHRTYIATGVKPFSPRRQFFIYRYMFYRF